MSGLDGREPAARGASGARVRRANAWLSAALLAFAVVAADALARRAGLPRRDLSEDQLVGFSPATSALLGRLRDRLLVEAYFTGEVRHGSVQIAKGRLLDQLALLERLAGGRMTLEFADPSASSEARLAAERAGVQPVPLRGVQGTAEVVQTVYLGLVLNYAGRQRTVPFVLPQGFEYAVAEALSSLLREREPRIGFLVERAGGDGESGEPFAAARALLAERGRLTEVRGLEWGDPLPEDLDLLVVAAPRELHARAAWAIDRHVGRGGRALFLLDRGRVDPAAGSARAFATGLEELVAAWGAPLSWKQVFDLSANQVTTQRVEPGPDGAPRTVRESLLYPYWVRVAEEGLSPASAATARLPGANLFWAQAFGPEPDAAGAFPPPPAGVERIDLLRSSARSWLAEPASLPIEAPLLEAVGAELAASGGARSRPLAVSLSGVLPSPWAGRAAPAPVSGSAAPAPPAPPGSDAPAHAGAGAGAASGAPDPSRAPAAVVLMGDADWVRDPFFDPENRLLLANLADWLLLEGDLVSIRSRLPRERRIADFEAEERAERGLGPLAAAPTLEQARERSRREEEAADAAERRRWMHMGTATGGSLALAGLFLLAARAAGSRP